MDKHIDALGYLLTAVVFSVGFLSARAHAAFEAAAREATSVSWRVRETILAGRPLGPEAIAELLAVVKRVKDPVTNLARFLNIGIGVAAIVVFVDGITLKPPGSSGPPHARVLLGALWLIGFAVLVVGEFDLRRVRRDQRDAIQATTLGRLASLAKDLESDRHERARKTVGLLRAGYPSWGLLQELDAYLSLRAGRAADGLKTIHHLVEHAADLYASPQVGVACALQEGQPATARELLVSIERNGKSTPQVPRLRGALSLKQGHAGAVFGDIEASRGSEARRLAPTIATDLRRSERNQPQGLRSLDLSPEHIEQTRLLLELVELWDGDGEPQQLASRASGTPLAAMLGLVLVEEIHVVDLDGLVRAIRESKDGRAIEALGMIQLARGADDDAAWSFERATQLMPASARAHWGMALSCERAGWTQRAILSASRSEILFPDRVAVRLVVGRAEGRPRPAAAEVKARFRGELKADNRAELALLGYDFRRDELASTIRGRFLDGFIALALSHASTCATPDGDPVAR